MSLQILRETPSPKQGWLLSLLVATCLLIVSSSLAFRVQGNTVLPARTKASAEGWITMPSGSRSSYIGIHGGTVPVSLLATKEGTGFVTFVGRTGNDFLELLLGSKKQDTQSNKGLPQMKNSHLFAGSVSTHLPVFAIAGEKLSNLSLFKPFGLSPHPLSIEGQVNRPDPESFPSKYHILVDPQYLHPRKSLD